MYYELWKRHGHKHDWQLGTDSEGDTKVYYVDEDGEEQWPDVCDDDEMREVEEQLNMVYVSDEWRSGWYDKDKLPRREESYGWREVESDYYRSVL